MIKKSELPAVSVLVPVRNEERHIENTLTRLLEQDYPNFELIIVDGDSDDATASKIENSISENGKLILLHIPRRIAASGLNVGLERATGDIIFRVDGHTEVPPDFISKSVELLSENPDVDCVGGYGEHVGKGPIGKAIAAAMTSVFGVGNAYFRVSRKKRLVDTLAFGAYRREVFDRIGNFDERLIRNQDDEFNARLRRSGGKILMSPEITYRYFPRGKLGALFTQYYQYGLWKARVASQMFKGYLLPRHLIPPLFLIYIFLAMVAVPILAVLGLPWWIPLIPVAVYVLLSLFYSIRADWRLSPLVALVFPVLHLSYGLGMILGFLLLPFWKAREASDNEVRRIREVYKRRYAEGKVYSPTESWLLYIVQDRVRRWAKIYRKKFGGGIPENARILDVGCGDGSDLFLQAHLGFEPENIFGVDINERAVPTAKERGFHVCFADGASLPFPDNYFDIVTANLVMFSIFDFGMLRRFAEECVRVSNPGGTTIVYELSIQPPYNKDVMIITRRKMRKIFRGHPVRFVSLTLNPLIARMVVPLSTTFAELLDNIPFMKTHYLAIVEKPKE
ncbi:MAG: glycosyltransferase [bacterium]|nr:glycosyltransferase [bacterium]